MMTRVFSGIQPTGNLHIGNYLGAAAQWLLLQEQPDTERFYCIVDYHTLTGDMSARDRFEQTIMTAGEYLALGLDPEKSTIFVQSHVPQHTELAWIFSTITPVAELERMTQYKDKARVGGQQSNTGLLTYPVLMAADILLYHTQVVPVGEDQIQHIELARLIARKFTSRYGEYFHEPTAQQTAAPRVKSLLASDKKMSKSLGGNHVIELADEPEVIEEKLKKAVTDPVGAENLLSLFGFFGSAEQHAAFCAAQNNGTIRYSDLKQELARAISDRFAEFREKRKQILYSRSDIADMLSTGASRAERIAEETMQDVRRLVGVRG